MAGEYFYHNIFLAAATLTLASILALLTGGSPIFDWLILVPIFILAYIIIMVPVTSYMYGRRNTSLIIVVELILITVLIIILLVFWDSLLLSEYGATGGLAIVLFGVGLIALFTSVGVLTSASAGGK